MSIWNRCKGKFLGFYLCCQGKKLNHRKTRTCRSFWALFYFFFWSFLSVCVCVCVWCVVCAVCVHIWIYGYLHPWGTCTWQRKIWGIFLYCSVLLTLDSLPPNASCFGQAAWLSNSQDSPVPTTLNSGATNIYLQPCLNSYRGIEDLNSSLHSARVVTHINWVISPPLYVWL